MLTSVPPPASPRPAPTATPPRRPSGAADPPVQSRCATRAGSGTGRGGGWPWGWTPRSSASPRGTPSSPPRPPRPRRLLLLPLLLRRRKAATRAAARPPPPPRPAARRRRWSSTWWGSPRTPCSSSAAGCAGGSPPASARRSGPPSSSWPCPPASYTPDRLDRSSPAQPCPALLGWEEEKKIRLIKDGELLFNMQAPCSKLIIMSCHAMV